MAKLKMKVAASAAAYTLVDLNSLEDDELRKDIIDDATTGGGSRYGIRVVEESVNGGARAPIFGVYKEGPDADRWNEAKKELGLSSSEVDDGDIAPVTIEITDARREAAVRAQAEAAARNKAAREREAEDQEVAAITGETDTDAARARAEPTANIVDETLDPDATNEVNDPDREEGDSKDAETTQSSRRRTNKAPK